MINTTNYTTAGKYQMPSVNTKDKEENYHLQVVQAIFNQYCSNQCSTPFGSEANEKYSMLRAYAKGKQDKSKYVDLMYGPNSLQRKRKKAFANISWDIPKVLPKFIKVAAGMLISKEYDIGIQAIDPASQKQREGELALIKWRMNPEFKSFLKRVGIAPPTNPSVKVPEFQNEEQVDNWARSGGLMLDQEIELWKLLQTTVHYSGMKQIQLKHAYDILELGCICAEDFVDMNTKKVLAKYINPERAIIQHSIYPDHHDIDFGGYHEDVTMSYLRSYVPVGNGKKLSDSQLKKVALGYKDTMGNMASNISSGFQSAQDFLSQTESTAINSFKVTLATLYFADQDIVKYSEATHKSGNLMVNTVSDDYEPSGRDAKNGKKVVTTRPSCTRFVKWIVGTDILLDWGKLDNSPRENSDKNYKCKIPIHFYRLEDPSLAEACIGFVDDLVLSVYKLRNTKAKMPPAPGMIVRKKYLDNMTLGGVKMSPTDVMDIFQDIGVLMINDTDDFGNPNVRGQPVDFLPTGVGEALRLYKEDIMFNIEQIRLYTGINELIDASTPSPETGLGVANISVDASNNAMKTLHIGYQSLFTNLLRSAASRWQSVILNHDISANFLPDGQNTYQVFNVSRKHSIDDIGLIIEARSTIAERNQILQELAALKNQRQSGMGTGITEADWLLLSSMVKAGNVKQAYQTLSDIVRERKIEAAEIAQMNMENTTKAQIESATATHQMAMEKLQAESQLKIQEIVVQEEEKRKTALVMEKEKRITIAVQGNIDSMKEADKATI
jgi:hypothetical protein